jgi:hypothetical protein
MALHGADPVKARGAIGYVEHTTGRFSGISHRSDHEPPTYRGARLLCHYRGSLNKFCVALRLKGPVKHPIIGCGYCGRGEYARLIA